MGKIIRLSDYRPDKQRVWKLEYVPENGWRCMRKVFIDTGETSIECEIGDIVLSTPRPPNCEPLSDAIFDLCLGSKEYNTNTPFLTYII